VAVISDSILALKDLRARREDVPEHSLRARDAFKILRWWKEEKRTDELYAESFYHNSPIMIYTYIVKCLYIFNLKMQKKRKKDFYSCLGDFFYRDECT